MGLVLLLCAGLPAWPLEPEGPDPSIYFYACGCSSAVGDPDSAGLDWDAAAETCRAACDCGGCQLVKRPLPSIEEVSLGPIPPESRRVLRRLFPRLAYFIQAAPIDKSPLGTLGAFFGSSASILAADVDWKFGDRDGLLVVDEMKAALGVVAPLSLFTCDVLTQSGRAFAFYGVARDGRILLSHVAEQLRSGPEPAWFRSVLESGRVIAHRAGDLGGGVLGELIGCGVVP